MRHYWELCRVAVASTSLLSGDNLTKRVRGVPVVWYFVAAEIVSTFDHPELVRLGHCDLIEEVLVGEDSLIRFSGVGAGEACTIVVRVTCFYCC